MKFHKLIYPILLIVTTICFPIFLSCIKEEPFKFKNNDNNKRIFDTLAIAADQARESEFHETFIDAMESDIDMVLDNLEINGFTGPVEDERLGSCVQVHVDTLGVNGWPRIITLTFNCNDTIDGMSARRCGKIIVLIEATGDSLNIYERSIYNKTNSDYQIDPCESYCIITDSTSEIYPISFVGTRLTKRVNANKKILNNGNICRYEIKDSIYYSGSVSNCCDFSRNIKTIRTAILYFNKSGLRWKNDLKKDTIFYTGNVSEDYYYSSYSRKIITPLTYTFYSSWPYNRVISEGSAELINEPSHGLIGKITYRADNNNTIVIFTRNDTIVTFQRTMVKFIKGSSYNEYNRSCSSIGFNY